MTTGNNAVIIAVLDEGVSPNHPDLPDTRQVRLNGSNFGNGDPNDPSPQNNNNHGNSCAGLIAASQNNNEGISGIAPNCRIMPIRIFNGDCSGIAVDRLAAAIDFARVNGAHIISSSWGFGQGATNPNLFPVIVQAIQTATTQGRGGLGCVVAFSASNSADHANNQNGEVRFPSNVNIAGVLTVGASERDDFQANYSPTSNPASGNNQIVDIVAPSHRAYPDQIFGETLEVWTIDIPGNVGYNPWPPNIGNCQFVNPPFSGEQVPDAGVNFNSYTARFGGTSAACPQVAAVSALVLSMNPNLTQQEVFDILTNSADDVGGYLYTNGRSNELGAGRLNACAAVTQTLAISGPSSFCTNETYSVTNLPPGSTVTWSVSGVLTISGSNTANPVTINGSGGNGTLSASVTSACGNVVLMPKQIITGTPAPDPIQGPTSLCPGDVDYFSIPAVTGASYNWDMDYELELASFTTPATNQIFVRAKAGFTGGYVYLTLTNSCGSSGRISYWVGMGSSCSYFYSYSPNPANNELNITYREPSLTGATTTSSPSKEIKKQFEVVLFNEKAEKLRAAQNNGSNNIKLDIQDIPDGTYYLHITEDKKVIKKQVIIRH